jgi:hypothetical protein
MDWKRGGFRVWLLLSVVWVLWAGWKALIGVNLEARSEWYQSCYAANALERDSNKLADCIARAVEGTPVGVDMLAQYPKESAIVGALILAAPVVVWWLLRGIVALGAWVARGFASAAVVLVCASVASGDSLPTVIVHSDRPASSLSLFNAYSTLHAEVPKGGVRSYVMAEG